MEEYIAFMKIQELRTPVFEVEPNCASDGPNLTILMFNFAIFKCEAL